MNYERLTKRNQEPKTIFCFQGSMEDFKIYKRLQELEDKIEQGLIIDLPCKVGDTVYYETFRKNGRESIDIQPHEIRTIYTVIETSDFDGYGITKVYLTDIGKTVFLTREEAEKRLKELQNG